ncbi:MAG TPA: polyprenyl synthetase family protein [Syntrophales bacterium]|nr:polyprenyl synthetase family protein [Syntrophobacterales bacterium]HQL89218.1 polyprenyl synthetase family protein [Syntrophales bacterium]
MITNPKSLDEYLQSRKTLVDQALELYLPAESTEPSVIFRSARYSVFAGGKRLRPILCIGAAEAVGGPIDAVMPAACALELIHTYSLIHDDLPAMDNDDTRRGKPTSHKIFGEAVAILAGDALLTDAFRIIAGRTPLGVVKPETLLQVIQELALAAGWFGMVGGQVADIESEGKAPEEKTLHFIHTRKTGALITVSLRAGALLGGADAAALDALTEYGRHVGLAFQIADDILNVEGDAKALGKGTGSDRDRGKLTYPALVGMETSKRVAAELVEKALGDLSALDERAEPLRMIARFIVERKT